MYYNKFGHLNINFLEFSDSDITLDDKNKLEKHINLIEMYILSLLSHPCLYRSIAVYGSQL